MTWSRSRAGIAVHIRGPVFSDGGGVVDGMSDRNGAQIYTIGKQYRKIRHDRIVPIRAFTNGYTKVVT